MKKNQLSILYKYKAKLEAKGYIAKHMELITMKPMRQ